MGLLFIHAFGLTSDCFLWRILGGGVKHTRQQKKSDHSYVKNKNKQTSKETRKSRGDENVMCLRSRKYGHVKSSHLSRHWGSDYYLIIYFFAYFDPHAVSPSVGWHPWTWAQFQPALSLGWREALFSLMEVGRASDPWLSASPPGCESLQTISRILTKLPLILLKGGDGALRKENDWTKAQSGKDWKKMAFLKKTMCAYVCSLICWLKRS